MAKTFAGARLRRLREEQGLTQVALARALDLSTSYVNQLENDQRPLTVAVLLAIAERFDLPTTYFAPDSDARLVADLRACLPEDTVSSAQIEELVARMPAVGQTLVSTQRRLHDLTSELEGFQGRAAGGGGAPGGPMPFEEVRDFFYDRKNYIDELDRAAEDLVSRHRLRVGELDTGIAALLADRFGVTVALENDGGGGTLEPRMKRSYRPDTAVLRIARWLSPGQRAFQLATQLALMSQQALMEAILDTDDHLSPEARNVARIGLANYFAGALLMPYRRFLDAAETLHYDVDRLARMFDVGFESVCHRLSSLQRPRERGIPFIFVRTDSAGNISKRQSATAFHFSRVGGNCPLWVVHNAFARPGEFLTQVASMPDGRSYFWIARTTETAPVSHLSLRRRFAVGLGCDLEHAEKLVYSAGVDLADQRTVVPIGPGCKVCDRTACPQRAFPYLGAAVRVDLDTSTELPYPPAPGR